MRTQNGSVNNWLKMCKASSGGWMELLFPAVEDTEFVVNTIYIEM